MRTSLPRTVSTVQEPLLWSGLVVGLILLLGWATGSQFVFPGRPAPGTAEPPPGAAADAKTQARVTTTLEQLPLLFIENRGQLDPEVTYYIQGRANTLYFTSTGVTFALTDAQALAAARREGGFRKPAPPATPSRWVVKLDFLDANPQIKPQAEAPQQAIISYFKGQPEDWQTGLKTYGQLRYPNLWPGIDLVYSGTVNRLKYHFEVQPGADPNQIRLAYRGASRVTLTDAGQLDIVTPAGGFQDDRPVAWQEVAGQRMEVTADYTLAAPAEGSQTYGFRLGSYDSTRPLLLDPAVIVYAGYIGGSSTDFGRRIAVDGAGAAYVTGETSSTEATFPDKVGPDLTFNGGGVDVFVAKVAADGTGLVYAGYIGGSGQDWGLDIAVDGTGAAYVTGYTESTQATFPVKIGPDLTFNGYWDAFVAKVAVDGAGLVYAGYIGGSSGDSGKGITVDRTGAAYVTGYTESTQATFPVKRGPDLTSNGGYDAFVAKVTADGSGLVYAGYIGGGGYDQGSGIAVDGAGTAYVTGWTNSTEATFPVKIGPDLTHNGDGDAFVAKVAADGAGLVYAGYIGGDSFDYGSGIAVDGGGAAYVTGKTSSTAATFPVQGGPDLTYHGNWDAFVARVRPDGAGLVYAGYIGGSDLDEGSDIAVDGAGAAYVTGYTKSTQATFPVKIGPDLTFNGYYDAFVAKVAVDGAGLVYAGYIGGSGRDGGCGLAVDGAGAAYVTGETSSTEATFPVQGGPDLTFNGASDNDASDAFVAKISANESPPPAATLIAPTGTITDNTPTYQWHAVPTASWYYLWVNDRMSTKIKQWYTAEQAGCIAGTGVCAVTPSQELAPGAATGWLQTWNTTGYGPWSAARGFTVKGNPPPAATLTSPTGTITNPTPTYTWNAVPTASWYYLWVNDRMSTKIQQWYTAEQAGCAAGTGLCKVTPSKALLNGAATGWLQTWNLNGYGPWSPGLGFTVQGAPPPAATLIRPTGPIKDHRPTYTWNAVPTATWYYLRVNDRTGVKLQQWYTAAQAGCAAGDGVCAVTPTTTLAPGAATWWIQTWNSGGYGPSSPPLSFTLIAQFTLTVNVAGNRSGTVNINPPGMTCNGFCEQTYDGGQEVTLTASPTGTDSQFFGWSGDCSGTKTCAVTMTGAKAVTAQFCSFLGGC